MIPIRWINLHKQLWEATRARSKSCCQDKLNKITSGFPQANVRLPLSTSGLSLSNHTLVASNSLFMLPKTRRPNTNATDINVCASHRLVHFKRTKTISSPQKNSIVPLCSSHSARLSHKIHRYLTSNFQTRYSTKMALVISGKEVSEDIRQSLRARVLKLPERPKLAIVQVGQREDSNVYIRMKIQFAESIGVTAELIKLSSQVSEEELVSKIQELNRNPSVHGLMTQLPFDCLTDIDSNRVVNTIDPKKDVDGLSVYSAGKLLHGDINSSSYVPCTPKGCMELIERSGAKVLGSRSVVLGRSKIVGSPMAQLLLWNGSTVTICHSQTVNIEDICRQADILVVAVGRAQMVKKSWLKPGAVVIDCGINVIPDSTRKSGTRLVGDVDFDDCKEVAGAITPVPGGVGPMTVAMLLANTVDAAERAMPRQ